MSPRSVQEQVHREWLQVAEVTSGESADEEDEEPTDLQRALESFVKQTATLHQELAELVGRPDQDSDMEVRCSFWSAQEQYDCRNAIESWGDGCMYFMMAFWKHHLEELEIIDLFDEIDLQSINLLSLKRELKEDARGVSEEVMAIFNKCMESNGRELSNKFEHFDDPDSHYIEGTKEVFTSEIFGVGENKTPYDQINADVVFEYASLLVELVQDYENCNLNEALEEYWADISPKQNYASGQVYRRLQELHWKKYVQGPIKIDELSKAIDEQKIVVVHGDGGLGKTALVYETIRKNYRGATSYVDWEGNLKKLEKFEYIVMLTTRTDGQKIWRSIEPQKGLLEISRKNEAAWNVDVETSFETLTRMICEIEGHRWLETNNRREEALKILRKRRILILLDNFEDVQKKRAAEGRENEYMYPQTRELFQELLEDFGSEGTPERIQGRIIITSRLHERIGQAKEIELKPLSSTRSLDLAQERYRHLVGETAEIPFPYEVNENVLQDLTELTKNPKKLDNLLRDAFGENTQFWGHPLLVFVVTWRLAKLGQNKDFKGKDARIFEAVMKEIESDHGDLPNAIKGLAHWTTSVSTGLFDDEWMDVYWLLIGINRDIDEKLCKDLYELRHGKEPIPSMIRSFMRDLHSSGYLEQDNDTGRHRFGGDVRARLLPALEKHLENLDESGDEDDNDLAQKFRVIFNEYVKKVDSDYETIESPQIDTVNLLKAEMDTYLNLKAHQREAVPVKNVGNVMGVERKEVSTYFPKLYEEDENKWTRGGIDLDTIPHLIEYFLLTDKVHWTDPKIDEMKPPEPAKKTLEQLKNQVDERIVKIWESGEIRNLGTQGKAAILQWLVPRIESTKKYDSDQISIILRHWKDYFQREEFELLGTLLSQLLIECGARILQSSTEEDNIRWCFQLKLLHTYGCLDSQHEFLCGEGANRVAELLNSDATISDRSGLVDFLGEIVNSGDASISEGVFKALDAEVEGHDSDSDDFQITSVKHGQTIIVNFDDGELKSNSEWHWVIQDFVIKVSGVVLSKPGHRMRIRRLAYKGKAYDASFVEWIEQESDEIGSVLHDDVAENIKAEIIAFAEKLLVEHRERWDKDEEEDLFMRMSVLGNKIVKKFNISKPSKNYYAKLGYPNLRKLLESDLQMVIRLMYRGLGPDQYHSVRLRKQGEDAEDKMIETVESIIGYVTSKSLANIEQEWQEVAYLLAHIDGEFTENDCVEFYHLLNGEIPPYDDVLEFVSRLVDLNLTLKLDVDDDWEKYQFREGIAELIQDATRLWIGRHSLTGDNPEQALHLADILANDERFIFYESEAGLEPLEDVVEKVKESHQIKCSVCEGIPTVQSDGTMFCNDCGTSFNIRCPKCNRMTVGPGNICIYCKSSVERPIQDKKNTAKGTKYRCADCGQGFRNWRDCRKHLIDSNHMDPSNTKGLQQRAMRANQDANEEEIPVEKVDLAHIKLQDDLTKEAKVLTKTSLSNALSVVENTISTRKDVEKELLRLMRKTNRAYSRKKVEIVVKQFENNSMTDRIGSRTRKAWIKELRRRFKEKFSGNQEYDRLMKILDELETE